ncbi:hypothetical protein [Paenibacillus dakarensis]|uniref:hypothetical protein n=1 Tax=Paenibacillus dakarensis TaxID=1527293 RepID=UPI0006D54D79|nr:hypothetical protein [Paenibacillus dakarensis]
MSFIKLNSLALAYAAARSDVNFRSLYEEANAVFRKMNRVKVVRSGYGDEADADEILDAVVWRLSKRDDVKDFGRMMSTALKNARLDLFRSETSRRKGIDYDYADREESTPILEIPTEETPEKIFLEREKEADQRQLIDFLVSSDSGEPDATTTAIVEAIAAQPSAKDTAIAKSLGIHHEIVKRKFRKLYRRYDANRFGDYREYLAV